MDKAALVGEDRETERLVLGVLTRAKIPVTLFDWDYVGELDEWQLVIATPWYDSKGPREAYSRIIKALEDAGVYRDVPISRVFVKSPEDPLVKALEREVKERREGAIHILGDKGPHKKQYTVIFAPFTGRGGFVPARHLSGLEELREFLDRRLHIQRSSVEEALAQLARKGSASIFNVQLTSREAKRLGLA